MRSRRKEIAGVAAAVAVAIASFAIFIATKPPPPLMQAHAPAWPPPLPVPKGAVDLAERRSLALHGQLPDSTAPAVESGTVWASARGPGFGRHRAIQIFRLADPAWLLVLAESGLWLVETETLARRARFRAGLIAAVDVSPDGKRIAYTECALARGYNHDLRRSSSDEPCALVVLEFPSLAEVVRISIKSPGEVRFSADGRTLTRVGDRVDVMPLDRDRPAWSAGHFVVSAIAFGEARVAYLSGGGHLVIEERTAEKAILEQETTVATTGGLNLGFIEFGGSEHFGGTLYFDASRDRLVGIGRTEALVVEQASSASPKLVRGAAPSTVEAVVRPRAIGFDRAELARKFGLDAGVWKLEGPLGHLLFGPSGEALWIADGYVARVDRRGITRAADFGPAPDRWEAHVGDKDMVLYLHTSQKMLVRRVPLAPPQIDATPERLGEFESETVAADGPLSFPNGDRFFFAASAADRVGIVRLPLGGPLRSIEWLDAKAPSVTSELARGPDRHAFVKEGRLVEITLDRATVLERGVADDEKLSWETARGCWGLTSWKGDKRFVGCP